MTRYKKTMSEAYREVYNLSEKMSSSQIAKLKKAYEPMRGKKISTANAEKLMKIMDMVDKDKNVLIQLFKADIPFVSELAVTRLITKHKMKGAEINKLKSEALDKEDEPKVKELIKKLKGASQAHAGQAKDLEKALKEQPEHEVTVGNYTTKFFHMCGSAQTTMKKHASKDGAEELAKMQDMFYKMEKDAMESGSVSDEQKEKAQALYDKIMSKAKDVGIEDEVGKYMKMHLDSMLKGNPKLGFGRTDVSESLEEKYDLYHKTFSGAMQHAYDYAKKKMGITVDPKEIDSKVATGPRKPSEGKTNTYRLKGKGGNLQIQVYNKGGSKPFELNMYKESVELDEVTMSKALNIDPKDADRMKTLAVLYTRAMKLPAGSPKQDKFKKEIQKLRKELGMSESVFEELVKSVELDEKVKEYKGVAYFKTRKDAEAHMKKFAPKGRVVEYERGYAVQTRISGPYLNKAGKTEEVELDEKVEYVEYKFRNKNDAMKAKKMLDAVQLMGFEINDDNISGGELMVDAGNKDMTKYHKEIMKKFRPKVLTQESLEEKFSPKEIKMAIGIASDPRYAKGNYSGAVRQIEKIKKGLSTHKQVAAVLKRQNEELDESKKALKKKAEKSGVSVGILSKVYDRGMAAWKGGHRPGTTPQQWALARVNSFLTGGGARKADNDLWKKAKKEEVGLDEDAVKSAQMKLDKAKKIQDLKDKIKDIRDEGARADAMRAMRTKRGVDPADVDDDATDDDMKAASKNILMQLRKSVSLGKNFKVEFGDKKKMPVDPKIAQAVINKYMSFRKPMDKEKFQSKIAKSYKDMLRAMKESIHEEDKPDNTKFTDRIKKAQERVRNATKGTQEHSDALDALQNAKDAYANYKKKTTGGKVKSALKKAAVATGIGAIATAKLGDSYDPKIKREAILDRIDKKLEEKKNG